MARRPSPTLIVAFLALLVSVSGVAFGTIPARDGDIHLCYSKKSGDVQLVDTQRDRFTCEQNWRGAIIDTSPTSLTSPDGRFKVEATNTGARLTGPDGTIEITSGKVRIVSDDPVQVTSGKSLALVSGTDLSLQAGNNVTTTANKQYGLAAGQNGTMAFGTDLLVQTGANLNLRASDEVKLRGRRAAIDSDIDFIVTTKDIRMLASGLVDIFASGVVHIKGSQVQTEP